MKCSFSGKEGFVEEETCHCFCCGTHKVEVPSWFEESLDAEIDVIIEHLKKEEKK